MKKYPVIYNGEEYEVRWKRGVLLPYVSIKLYRKQGIFWKFVSVYEVDEDGLDRYFVLDSNDENYRINQAKYLIKVYISNKEEQVFRKETIKRQKDQLQKWDGTI